MIIDFIIVIINAERRRHATLPYGMFHTTVFIWAQLPLDGHSADNKRPTTTMKTFSALGLKPQGQEKEKEKESKKKKNVAAIGTTIVVPSTRRTKSKPSNKGKKKKKRREKSLSPIPEERRKSKRRFIKLAKESPSSSKTKGEVFTIAAEPINMANTTTTPAAPLTPCTAKPAQRRIIITELAQEEPTPKDVLEGKGKKK